MDLQTIILQLSSTLQNRLSSTTFTHLLSTLSELSAVPSHPYKRLKYDLFGKDYNFKTINDIEPPVDFCVENCLNEITEITNKTNQMTLCALSSLHTFKPSLFETPMIVEKEFLKKNIEFIEIVKTMDINDIETKPLELAQKLTSYYVKNCQ